MSTQKRRPLSSQPTKDGLYLAQKNCPDSCGAYAYDDPSFLYSFGPLDGRYDDHKVMEQFLRMVMEKRRLYELRSRDFSLMAMTAARLGKTELALDLLLMDSPKNTYTANRRIDNVLVGVS